jgi:hypothetical protein
MKTHQNYVKLIGLLDGRKQAWKTSRPQFTEENLNFDKVAEMDLSLNSMLVFCLEMRSSVIFRDLLFSLRPMEGWALSTRSMPINLDTVRLSSEFDDRDDYYDQILQMFELLEDGSSRDQARGVLPCAASSTYTLTIDFRVLMSFCKTIEMLNPRLFMEYCAEMLEVTGTVEMYKTTTVRPAYEYYKIHDNEKIYGTAEAGNMVFGHFPMKMALASQFLRQHYSRIKIGLWNDVANYYDLDLTQNSMVDVAFYIDSNSYARLMAMRAHWVIDWSQDMWGGIVGDYVKDMTSAEFWEFLPNGGGKVDPYWADVYNRVLGEDPGMPCPVMCEWPRMIDLKEQEVGPSPIIEQYRKLVAAGYIKDNPQNEHRQKALSCRDDIPGV